MLGFVTAYCFVLAIAALNFAINIYVAYRTDEVKHFVAALLSVITGAFMVGLIINHMLYVYPVLNGR